MAHRKTECHFLPLINDHSILFGNDEKCQLLQEVFFEAHRTDTVQDNNFLLTQQEFCEPDRG